MDDNAARETLREVTGITERIKDQARAPLTPLFVWAAAAAGGGIVSLIARSMDGPRGFREFGRPALIVTLYWLIIMPVAALITNRIYKQRAVVAPREKWSPLQMAIFALVILFFGSGLVMVAILTAMTGGIWFVIVPFAMAGLGRFTSDPALERAGVYSIPGIGLAMAGGHVAAVWMTVVPLVTAVIVTIRRRRSA